MRETARPPSVNVHLFGRRANSNDQVWMSRLPGRARYGRTSEQYTRETFNKSFPDQLRSHHFFSYLLFSSPLSFTGSSNSLICCSVRMCFSRMISRIPFPLL